MLGAAQVRDMDREGDDHRGRRRDIVFHRVAGLAARLGQRIGCGQPHPSQVVGSMLPVHSGRGSRQEAYRARGLHRGELDGGREGDPRERASPPGRRPLLCLADELPGESKRAVAVHVDEHAASRSPILAGEASHVPAAGTCIAALLRRDRRTAPSVVCRGRGASRGVVGARVARRVDAACPRVGRTGRGEEVS